MALALACTLAPASVALGYFAEQIGGNQRNTVIGFAAAWGLLISLAGYLYGLGPWRFRWEKERDRILASGPPPSLPMNIALALNTSARSCRLLRASR